MGDSIPQGKRVIVWRKHYLIANRKHRFRTICEVLREVHLDAKGRGDAVTMAKMDEATDMAKRMQKRIEMYAGSNRTSLVHFETGYAWVSKDRMYYLSEDEASLIESNRIRQTKRVRRAKQRAQRLAAAGVP